MDYFQQTQEAKSYLQSSGLNFPTPVGIVLGSGLGALTQKVNARFRVAYHDIPHFPQPHVLGHVGELVAGELAGIPCVVLSGRSHYYEGYSWKEVTFSIRVLAALGVKTLIITNAAGGVNPSYEPGDFMAIVDHINLTSSNPLQGPSDERLGVRFPDMSEAYNRNYRKLWHKAARVSGIHLREGVYVGLSGPSYETPAEIRMLQRLGADAVGMSTVSEVIVARHAGMQVAGLSVITNRAAGLSERPLSHQEVTEVGLRMRDTLCELISHMVVCFDL